MAEKSKPEKKKEATPKQEEKVLTIPLRSRARRSSKNKRMNRSVREIKAFLARHMRTEPSNVSISQQLNESLWRGGVHNPPSSIKIKVSTGEEGKVSASLMDEKERVKKESKRKLSLRQRLARRREQAKEEKEKPVEIKEKPAEEKKPEPPKEKDSGKKEQKAPSNEKEEKPSKEAPEEIFEEDLK